MTDIVAKLKKPWPYSDVLAIMHEAAHEIESLRSRLSELKGALREIAAQKLNDEMTGEDYKNADFEDGYEACVKRARAALPSPPQEMK